MRVADHRRVRLYDVVDAAIRQRLIDNVWKPGTMLPSEMQLAADLNVSQGTVRRALDALVAEGLLVRRQGVGTFVSTTTNRRELYLYFNLASTSGAREMSQIRYVSRSSGPALAREAERLGIGRNANVIRFKRVRSMAQRPMIIESIVVPEALFADLAHEATPPEHLFRHYESRYGITVAHADEFLTAGNASTSEARLLEVEPGTALLKIDRIAFRLGGTRVEWRRSSCDTTRHRYEVHRGAASDLRH